VQPELAKAGAVLQLVLETPLGWIGVQLSAGQVTSVDFLTAGPQRCPPEPTARAVQRQFAAYFADGHYPFDLPLRLPGTPFQQRVWAALCRIPAGEVRTYGGLARELGSSARAVGNACRANPVPIVIPCHRVVAAAGIGGYSGETAGEGLRIKGWLLAHEGVRL
jgi:methylated-DNA-[protein]-cysteine S-methyltransferase